MDIIGLIGVSFVTALATGAMMGFYLAALNRFIPVVRPLRSLVTNIVIAISFFFPIALQRVVTDDPTLRVGEWLALALLYLVFATAADTTNYFVCRRKGFTR